MTDEFQQAESASDMQSSEALQQRIATYEKGLAEMKAQLRENGVQEFAAICGPHGWTMTRTRNGLKIDFGGRRRRQRATKQKGS